MSLLAAAGTRFAQIVATACVLGLVVAGAVVWLANGQPKTVTAYFENGVALFEGNHVVVLGVPVGSVASVQPQGTVVRAELEIDSDVRLPADVQAAIVSPSLVTGRNVQLAPAYTGGPELPDDAVIGRERTQVPLEVDDLSRTATELATMLGPNGVNSDGTLSDLLDVGAANLEGNGQALNDALSDYGQLAGTLANSREELFGTVTELQSFVSTISANDDQVRRLNTQLAEVSGFLAGERDDLGAALHELSIALGDVSRFVQDNREAIRSNVTRLTEVTEVLVRQRDALAEISDVAPTGLGNLMNTYDAASGTLGVRMNVNELSSPPILFVCELLRRGTPPELPPAVSDLCLRLEPVISGAVPLPAPSDVITALQNGQPPPVPGLALPTTREGSR